MMTKWPAIGLACALMASGSMLAGGAAARPGQNSTAAQTLEARQPAVVHSAPARISRVEVTTQGQDSRVRIVGHGDFHYKVSKLENPTRLVVDFADTTLAGVAGSVPSGSTLIRNVRAGQFQADVARVVVELDHWSPYTVLATNDGVVVVFGSSPDVSDVQTASVHSAVFQKTGATRPPAVKTVRRTQIPNVPAMPLPAWLTETNFAFASQAQPLPPAPQAQPMVAQPVQQQMAAQSATTPSAAAQGPTHYSGEPISVNLKDADLQDFFRLIHEISGLNVVLDPSVKGSLTLVLDNVPWDQALDIVLKNNSLEKSLDGNVLRIATRATVRSEMDAQADLVKAQQAAVQTVTFSRRLSYAKASNQGAAQGGKAMQGKGMDELLKPFLTSRGKIFGDPRTNTIFIEDIPSSIPRIDDMIHQLDRKSQQVEIEARVILASRSFAQDIGTQMGFAGGNHTGSNVVGGASSVGTSPIVNSGILPPLVSAGTKSLPLATNFPAIGPTSGFTFSHISQNFGLDFIITAMESKGVGKLLSAPNIVTQNNTEGTVQQGTQIPIQTNINNTISTQYINAVLMLKITPQITADGTIFMIVHLENTQIDSGIPAILGQPALATQSVDDSVIARDGETVKLGGVIIDQTKTQTDQVPLLGSVPLIGNLFKHHSVSVSSQELLFFLTPRVTQD